jgi:osmoprotectant transport system permease protein
MGVAGLVGVGLVTVSAQRVAWVNELLSYAPDLWTLSQQHLFLVGVSAGLAIISGVPLGILLSRPAFHRIAEVVMQVVNLTSTVPTLAVLALSMSLLGIGVVPAVFGLSLATLLPIVLNTYAGLKKCLWRFSRRQAGCV